MQGSALASVQAQVAPASTSNTKGSNNQVDTVPNTHTHVTIQKAQNLKPIVKNMVWAHTQSLCFLYKKHMYAHPYTQKIWPTAGGKFVGPPGGGGHTLLPPGSAQQTFSQQMLQQKNEPCYLQAHGYPGKISNCSCSIHDIKIVIYKYYIDRIQAIQSVLLIVPCPSPHPLKDWWVYAAFTILLLLANTSIVAHMMHPCAIIHFQLVFKKH